jgi:predicted PurR-regulated permease PerM
MTNLPPTPPSTSPSWGSTTKLVVGLGCIALFGALLIEFRGIIGPLILAFILAYLLHPLAARLTISAKIPWRASVNLVYILLIIILMIVITMAGLAILQQIQSLLVFMQRFITDLPSLLADLTSHVYKVGPFTFDLGHFDLTPLINQLLAAVQPLLGRVGTILSTLAASAAVTFGWTFFILFVSYFLLIDAAQVSDALVEIQVPGYTDDIQHMGQELLPIWNAFLRGQLIIITLDIFTYLIVMTLLGIRYAVGIAILAGLSRLVPYVGPFTTATVTALVAFFQGGNYFGIDPLKYAILCVVMAFLIDQTYDNVVSPRLLGKSLGVHPAAVLVAAIIAANLIGIIGLLLAAPVLATLKLVGRYVVRKLFDLDPWQSTDIVMEPVEMPLAREMRRFRDWVEQKQRRA